MTTERVAQTTLRSSKSAALRYTRQGRQFAEVLLKQRPDDYDAYLAVGVENYLSGIKPAPIRRLLSADGVETDKAHGDSPPRTDRHAWRPASSVRPTIVCRVSAPRQGPTPSLQPAHWFVAALHAQSPLPA